MANAVFIDVSARADIADIGAPRQSRLRRMLAALMRARQLQADRRIAIYLGDRGDAALRRDDWARGE